MQAIEKNNFCILPWSGLEINADGTVRPCCFFSDRIKDGNREMNVAVDSIVSIRNSQYLQNLRSDFLEDKKPEACNQCWKQESAGLSSARINSNRQYASEVKDILTNASIGILKNLGIALGNICNLKCRICGPWASSSWNADQIKTIPQDQLPGTIEEKMLTMGAWPLKNDSFWSQFAEEIKTVTKLKIYGGEPFMIPKHFEVLQFLVDNHYSQNIKIVYNTNGTQFPTKSINLWKEFKRVELAISIDNLGDKFKYERKNADWNLLVSNLEKFNEIQRQQKNIKLQCVVTVSIYNVLNLIEIAQWLEQQEFTIPTFWNILHFAEHHSIAHLSQSTKEYIKNKLTTTNAKLSTHNRNNIDNIVKYMMDNNPGSLEHKLVQEIKRVDQFRLESLCKSHSELAALLGYDG
jgi:MoaA/NifB/PqqE/SkfB family radical SAM enzyme